MGEFVHHVWGEGLAGWTAQPASPEATATDPNLMISSAPVSPDLPSFQENRSYKVFPFSNASSDFKEKIFQFELNEALP